MIEWQPILNTGVKVLAPKILEAAIAASQKSFKEKSPYNKLKFDRHFESAYNRCTKIKTIVNGDSPINLLENYVNPDFKFKDTKIDEYKFIDEVFEKKFISLVGSAGSGKSMFMRYFWICCSIEPKGKIPLFVELRKYNDITQDDFLTYVYHLTTDIQENETRDLFDRAIKEGQFIFILDGFDEVKSAKRESCESAILKLSETNNVVIVSGRHDETYHSWQMFCLYEMMPLSLKQTVRLIENIDFDKTAKRKFISQLKGGLFSQHESFASRPLLATMMLLTFGSFADIPQKIHVFYDQAFDTLFSRHDATKEAFKRERKTDYSIDVFKKFFSLFCLLTYNEADNDFSEAKILEKLQVVAKIENTDLKADLFLKDCVDAICLIQKDGLKYVFSHRSFQEYFTAYALARLPESKVGDLLERFSERPSDSVIPMLFDMNRSLVERTYISQALNKYKSATIHLDSDFDAIKYVKIVDSVLFIQKFNRSTEEFSLLIMLLANGGGISNIRDIMVRLYEDDNLKKDIGMQLRGMISRSERDLEQFKTSVMPALFPALTDKSGPMILSVDEKIMLNRRVKGKSAKFETANITSKNRISLLQDWIRSSEWAGILKSEHDFVIALANSLEQDIARREKTIEEMLSL